MTCAPKLLVKPSALHKPPPKPGEACMKISYHTQKPHKNQHGKTLSLYPLMWLGTTIVIAIALKSILGGAL